MSEFAWQSVIHSPLNQRTVKPRRGGITMVIDTGLGLQATNDVLEISDHLIDHWKLSFGTSVFMRTEVVKNKLAMLRDADVLTYPGGTLLEVALVEHHCRVYMHHARRLGFTAVEISDGTIPVPRFRRKKIIDCARDAGLEPITEVGKKDPKRQPTADQIAEQALEDLDWGADWVVVEGRETGKGIGIYDEGGNVESQALARIAEIMGAKVERLIWEAPLKQQQSALINRFGPNVCLGNIPPEKMLAVESLRCGLRFETLHPITDDLLRRGRWDPEEVESGQLDTPEADKRSGRRS